MDGLRPGDPERVGRYRLLNRLGAGGMGQVYLGQSPSGRLVAVKVIRAELADDPAFRQRFALEVTSARRVSGMFTAPVVDADPEAPQPWMVTAYVSGPSLADAVTSRGPLPVRSVLMLAAGLAEGLGAVHAAGLVHRDLKPSNVLLATDGPRIIDFGISRAADSAGLTRAGGVIGSPGFMSPEQAEGRQVGSASDIFSLGSVLVFAATGEPPFGEGSGSVLLYRVVNESPALGNVPADVRSLIERCMTRDPAARPSTDGLLAELGYPEPTENWLSWQDIAGRDTDADTTEPGLDAVGAGSVAADLASPVPANPLAQAAADGMALVAGEALAAAAADGMALVAGEALAAAAADGMALVAGEALAATPGQPADAAKPVAAALATAGHPAGAVGQASGTAAAGLASALASFERQAPPGPRLGYEHSAQSGPLTGPGPLDQPRSDHWQGYVPPSGPDPDHSSRRRLAAGLAAVAIIIAVVAAALVAFDLVSRQSPRAPAAGRSAGVAQPSAQVSRGQSAASPVPHQPAAGAPGQAAAAAGVTPSAAAGVTPSAAASNQPSTTAGPGAVVLAYYAAINDQNWQLAWQLGGMNLYSSLASMIADLASVSRENVTILSVTGANVVARVSTLTIAGVTVVHRYSFLVQNGMIASCILIPPP